MYSLSDTSAPSSSPDPRSLPERLAEAIDAFGPAYVRWLQAGTRQSGTSYARLRLLDVLHCDGPQPMARIGERLGTTARNVTALVDGLEADGLVRRVPHPSDRRATIVEPTEAGASFGSETFAEQRARAAELFATLDPVDQATMLRLLEHLVAKLRAR